MLRTCLGAVMRSQGHISAEIPSREVIHSQTRPRELDSFDSNCSEITPGLVLYTVTGSSVISAQQLALSAVLLDGRFDGTAGLGEIVRHHHRMNLNTRVEREEPRLGNRRDL